MLGVSVVKPLLPWAEVSVLRHWQEQLRHGRLSWIGVSPPWKTGYPEGCSTAIRRVVRKVATVESRLVGSEVASLRGCSFPDRWTCIWQITKSNETERGNIEKLSTETKKQAKWTLMEAPEESEVVLERRRWMHLGAPLRSWQSPQLTEMDQSRDCEQTWNSLQRCIIVFPPDNSHMDTGYTLHGRSTVYTLQWEHG